MSVLLVVLFSSGCFDHIFFPDLVFLGSMTHDTQKLQVFKQTLKKQYRFMLPTKSCIVAVEIMGHDDKLPLYFHV